MYSITYHWTAIGQKNVSAPCSWVFIGDTRNRDRGKSLGQASNWSPGQIDLIAQYFFQNSTTACILRVHLFATFSTDSKSASNSAFLNTHFENILNK